MLRLMPPPASHSGQPRTPQSIIYRIDADDCLAYFNPAWIDSLATLERETLGPEHLLGRKLWCCLEDQAVCDLYVALVERARSGRPVTFEYRCDTATRRRTYRMEIRPRAEQEVEFCSTLVREIERPSVALLDPAQARDDAYSLAMCSWCQAIALPVNYWVPIEQAAALGGFLAADRIPRLKFTVCPACQDAVQRKLQHGS